MKTAIDLDAITIDGNKLREAREARNLSVAELAALVTLSRDQIKAIEEGGNRPFYTPAHKLLAVRKYANALEIAYEDVVMGPGADQTVPAPEDAPPSMHSTHEAIEPAIYGLRPSSAMQKSGDWRLSAQLR
jgi:predicted transcriptional regulator